MIVDHDVTEKARAPCLHHEVPGHGDRERHQHAPPRNPRGRGPLACEPEEDRDDRHDHERVEKIACEHGEAQARVKDEEPAARVAEIREHEPGPGERDPEHEQELRPRGAAVDEYAEVRGDHEPGEQSQTRPAQGDAEARGQRRAAHRGQRGPEPRGERRRARRAERGRREPVEQRRLVDIAHAVDPRRDPVAGERHLTGDRGMKSFRRIEERSRAEPDHVQAGRHERNAERDAPHGTGS